MEKKNYSRAKVLIIIPLVVFVLTLICVGVPAVSYFSTGSDVAAVAMIFAGTMSALLTVLPCLVLSIIGTVSASKARKEGIDQAGRFFVIGTIEIIVYGLGMIGAAVSAVITVIALGS